MDTGENTTINHAHPKHPPDGTNGGNLQTTDHPIDDESNDDSECWDDAKALLHKDDDSDVNLNDDNDVNIGDNNYTDKHEDINGQVHRTHTMNASTTYPPSSLAYDLVDGPVLSPAHQTASSSSAYSSLQSANDNTKTPSLPPPPPQLSARSITSSSSTTSNSSDELILHEAIFQNDTKKIIAILNNVQLVKQRELVNKRDKHGNTALHLACMLGRPKEIISVLLQNEHDFKWSIDAKNLNRWTPFHEACSYGDRETITLMAKQLKDDVDDALHNSKLSDFLEKTKDYRLVLKWEFQSWVPFVSRVLPSDVCVIIKQGKCIRIDTRLLDFEGLFRKKGDSCLVYSGKKWSVVNHKTKKYQHFETPTLYKDIEEKVDEFMSTDIMDLELKSSDMQLTRSTSGWIWKAEKVGRVGRFNAALYDLNNVFLVTRKRREHLSEEDLKRNKIAYRSAVHIFKFGEKPPPVNQSQQRLHDHHNNGDDDNENSPPPPQDGRSLGYTTTTATTTTRNSNGKIVANDHGQMEVSADIDGSGGGGGGEEELEDEEEEESMHRESLEAPPATSIRWQEYLQFEPGQYPTLGREQKCKTIKTAVKASVAISEEFPLTKSEFLDLLSIIPIKMFRKLKEFVEMKLPDGFPVRLDIPVFPFLTARITFEDFAFLEEPINESLFKIPHDYELDTNLLPGRFSKQQEDQQQQQQQQQ